MRASPKKAGFLASLAAMIAAAGCAGTPDGKGYDGALRLDKPNSGAVEGKASEEEASASTRVHMIGYLFDPVLAEAKAQLKTGNYALTQDGKYHQNSANISGAAHYDFAKEPGTNGLPSKMLAVGAIAGLEYAAGDAFLQKQWIATVGPHARFIYGPLQLEATGNVVAYSDLDSKQNGRGEISGQSTSINASVDLGEAFGGRIVLLPSTSGLWMKRNLKGTIEGINGPERAEKDTKIDSLSGRLAVVYDSSKGYIGLAFERGTTSVKDDGKKNRFNNWQAELFGGWYLGDLNGNPVYLDAKVFVNEIAGVDDFGGMAAFRINFNK